MRALLCCTSLLCLVGCAGPKPPLPANAAIAAPSTWRQAVAAPATLAPDWWNCFEDPALSEAVTAALANNVDLELAAERVAEARAQFRLARGQRFPDAAVNVVGGRQRDVSPFGDPELQTAREAELVISYDLDLFGRLAAGNDAARAELLSAEWSRDSVRLAVAASTASAYIRLRSYDARLVVLHDTLAARRASLLFTRRRVAAGYAPELDLAQAESELRGTEQQIPVVELAIARQENGLSILLGESPRVIARAQPIHEIAVPQVPASVPADLLRQRPDVASAEQSIVAADRALDAARDAFMPDVRLSLSGGFVASTLLADPIKLFSLGGSVLAPIFEGGQLRARADIASTHRNEAAYRYRKIALTAFREVEDALAAIDHDATEEQALELQRDALRRSLRFATNRYRAGYSAYIEQLDAQRALLAVELSAVQARADRLTAMVDLYQALGGGWSAPDEPGQARLE